MPFTPERCSQCGKPLPDDASELSGGAWDIAVCAACSRRRLLEDGGAALKLEPGPTDRAFDPGEVQIRPGAVHILAQSGEHYWDFLDRHLRGDLGSFRPRTEPPESKPRRPRRAFLATDGKIVSEFRTNLGHRLWIMTQPGKLTAMMAPGEF